MAEHVVIVVADNLFGENRQYFQVLSCAYLFGFDADTVEQTGVVGYGLVAMLYELLKFCVLNLSDFRFCQEVFATHLFQLRCHSAAVHQVA